MNLMLAIFKRMIAESPSCAGKLKIKYDKRFCGFSLYYKRKLIYNCEAKALYHYLKGFIDAKDIE